MTTAENDNTDFDFSGPDWSGLSKEWANLPGDCPTDSLRLDALESAVADDPFATTRLDDCLVAFGVGPTPFDRYRRAHRAYLRSFHNSDDEPATTEIFRLIALYWLARSRSILVD